MKCFDAWTHFVVMLYAVIMCFDSLREITGSLQAEARKLSHLGISMMTSRCTLSDANKRCPESVFEADTMYQTPKGLEVRIQQVAFAKQLKNGEVLTHRARVITYADQQKHKLISLLPTTWS